MANIIRVVHGVDLHFVAEQMPEGDKEQAVHTMLRLLCDDWHGEWKRFLKIPVLKAILLKKSPEFIQLLGERLKDGFSYLFDQLTQLPMNEDVLLQTQIYVNNCLCYLPYTEPKLGDTIKLPQWVNQQWELIEFEIQPIPLVKTPKCGQFFTQSSDRFFAHGLVPVGRQDVMPKLVFQASSYPAGDGFEVALRSDLKSCHTPGEDILQKGQAKINQWAQSQTKLVEFVGISLGASMAIQAGLEAPNVGKIHAYNPAGYYKRDFSNLGANGIELNVIRNDGEPASKLGYFPPQSNIYLLKPEVQFKTRISLIRHALSYANKGSTEITQLDPESFNDDNRQNRLIYGPIRAIGDFGFIRPYHRLVRPLLHLPGNVICHLKSL